MNVISLFNDGNSCILNHPANKMCSTYYDDSLAAKCPSMIVIKRKVFKLVLRNYITFSQPRCNGVCANEKLS